MWISVKDRLPNENENVLTFSSGGGMTTAIFCYHHLTKKPTFILMPSCELIRDETLLAYLTNVTHWMPLPNAPEGE